MSRAAIGASALAVVLSGAALLRGPGEAAAPRALTIPGLVGSGTPSDPLRLPRCTMVDGDEHAGTIDVRDVDVVAGCWVAFRTSWPSSPSCEVTDAIGARLEVTASADRIVIPGATFGAHLHYGCR